MRDNSSSTSESARPDPTTARPPGSSLELSRQHLQAAVKIAPTAANLFLLARAEFMGGNWQAAQAACRQSIEAATPDLELLLLLAETQLRLKEPVEALKTAIQAVKLDKMSEDGWVLLARASAALGDTQRAMHSLEFYLKLARKQLIGPQVYLLLAGFYLENGQPRLALDQLEQAQARLRAHFIMPGPAFLTLRARILLGLDQYPAALDSYRQAIQLEPQNATLHNEMGKVVLERGSVEEALTAFRQALHLQEDNAEYHYNAGRAALQSATQPGQLQRRKEGLQQQAIQALTKATQLNPAIAVYWYELALAFGALPDYKQMKQVLVQALAQSAAFEEDEVSQVRYLRLYAKACEKLGDFKTAVQTLNQILNIAPDDHAAHNEQGELAYRLQNYPEAYNYFRRAETLAPDQPRYMANMSRVLLKLERAEEAYELIEEAARRDPNDCFVRFQLGAVLLAQGQAAAALDHLRDAASHEPDNAEFRYQLGRAYLQLNRLPDALAEYQEALANAPLQAQWHSELGEIYLRERSYLPALESLRLATQLEPTDPDNHYNLAIALASNGDILGAIRGLREAQTANKLDLRAEWHYLLGRLLLELGRAGEALDSFALAYRLEPGNPDYKVDYARCLRLKGEPLDRIKPLLESAIKVDPDNWFSFEELAYLYEASNQPEAAIQALETRLTTVLEAVRAL